MTRAHQDASMHKDFVKANMFVSLTIFAALLTQNGIVLHSMASQNITWCYVINAHKANSSLTIFAAPLTWHGIVAM